MPILKERYKPMNAAEANALAPGEKYLPPMIPESKGQRIRENISDVATGVATWGTGLRKPTDEEIKAGRGNWKQRTGLLASATTQGLANELIGGAISQLPKVGGIIKNVIKPKKQVYKLTNEDYYNFDGVNWAELERGELPETIIIDTKGPSKFKQIVDRYNPKAIKARKNLPPAPESSPNDWLDIPPPVREVYEPLPTDKKISNNLYLRQAEDGSNRVVFNPTTGEKVSSTREYDGAFTTYGNMTNELEAGKAILALQKSHAIGDKFAHPGSLSPDSWKFWMTRVNRGDLKPIDTGKVTPLNTMGKHTTTSKNMPSNILESPEEAQKIADELNLHIKDPRVPKVKMVELGYGQYSVQIPDLTYEKLRLILGTGLIGGAAAKTVSKPNAQYKYGGLLR